MLYMKSFDTFLSANERKRKKNPIEIDSDSILANNKLTAIFSFILYSIAIATLLHIKKMISAMLYNFDLHLTFNLNRLLFCESLI